MKYIITLLSLLLVACGHSPGYPQASLQQVTCKVYDTCTGISSATCVSNTYYAADVPAQYVGFMEGSQCMTTKEDFTYEQGSCNSWGSSTSNYCTRLVQGPGPLSIPELNL